MTVSAHSQRNTVGTKALATLIKTYCLIYSSWTCALSTSISSHFWLKNLIENQHICILVEDIKSLSISIFYTQWSSCLTWLHHSRLGPQVGQVDIGLPAINNWVGVLTGPVCSRAVRHRHLSVKEKQRWEKCGWLIQVCKRDSFSADSAHLLHNTVMSKSITNEWECVYECVFVRTCTFIVKRENIILDTGVGLKGVCALILFLRVCVCTCGPH